MSWYQTLTSAPILVATAIGVSIALVAKRASISQVPEQVKEVSAAVTNTESGKGKMAQAAASVMSPPVAELLPPKDDPISAADLAAFDGSDPSKPIYVAIKGKVFDVSPKREMYQPGQGYNVFAGKDASRGLGMSSLDPKDAIADFSGLDESQRKTLDQWEAFFEKRYNVVGRIAK